MCLNTCPSSITKGLKHTHVLKHIMCSIIKGLKHSQGLNIVMYLDI